MIKALRITLTGSIPYERVTIYSHYLGDSMPAPNLFEDSQLVFTCTHGTFVVPDYNIRLIQLHNRRTRAPDNAIRVKRILLADDLNYQDCYIVHQADYERYGIPQVFREHEQIAFICKDGLFLTPDFQTECIHLWEK